MARMDELYNDIYAHCEENECWQVWYSAKEWNEVLNKNYGIPSFTALVDANKLERVKGYRAKSFEYRIIPTGRIKELMEDNKKQKEKQNAEYIISHYEETIARRKATYEEKIREAEEQYKRDLEWEEERLLTAKSVLNLYE